MYRLLSTPPPSPLLKEISDLLFFKHRSFPFHGRRQKIITDHFRRYSSIQYMCTKWSIHLQCVRDQKLFDCFYCFNLALKSKNDLDSLNDWLLEKENYDSEVSSWLLLGFSFTFPFLVTQANMVPLTWALSKVRLKIKT